MLLTFGLVIFLHELGHFLMCRRLGIRVEKFAFGMGPELFGVTEGETRYSLCAFPVGGFVKPAGEELETCTGKPDEYYGQAWYRRLAIVYSGPVMNYCPGLLPLHRRRLLQGPAGVRRQARHRQHGDGLSRGPGRHPDRR